MKKIIVVLFVALGAALASCSCFDSTPIEPEIIGMGNICQSADVFYVEVDSVRYFVGQVYTGKRDVQYGGHAKVKPEVGMLVTVAYFQNSGAYGGRGIHFMQGEWSAQAIEKAYHENYTLSIVVGIGLIVICILSSVSKKN